MIHKCVILRAKIVHGLRLLHALCIEMHWNIPFPNKRIKNFLGRSLVISPDPLPLIPQTQKILATGKGKVKVNVDLYSASS